jgi:hypothetical protein
MLPRPFAATVLIALAVLSPPAFAQDPCGRDPAEAANAIQESQQPVTDAQAKVALKAQEKRLRSKDVNVRLTAVNALETVVHHRVAERLMKLVAREKDPVVKVVAYEALAKQGPLSAKLKARFAALVNAEAEAGARDRMRGRRGYVADPRTGKIVHGTKEADALWASFRERESVREAAIRTMLELGVKKGVKQKSMREFLQTSYDPVVVAALDAFAQWKDWGALRDVHRLFRYYPTEAKWDSSSAAQYNGDVMDTHRRWSGAFGDPGKRRGRPAVVAAIRKTVLAITGRKAETPKDLAKLLGEREVQRKMRAALRRK